MRYILFFILFASASIAEPVLKPEFETLENRVEQNQNKIETEARERSREARETEREFDRLEDDIEEDIEDNAAGGLVLFLSGAVCAMWAQFTSRSAWLWLFFGLILSSIALIALLWTTSTDIKSGRLRRWTDL